MTTPTSPKLLKGETTQGIARWALTTAVMLIIYAILLFLTAGRLDWASGWAYYGVIALTQVLSALVLIPRQPGMIAERSKAMREGTKSYDRLLVPAIAGAGPLAMLVTAALDARFGWSLPLGAAWWGAGAVVALGGGLFTLWAMASNPFFSATVRIQDDRGHHVVNQGPYRFVRHPGYLGSVVFDLATPLALGSLWAFLPALLTVLLILIRTRLEDRTLQAELPGYAEYAQTVRRRIIPWIW